MRVKIPHHKKSVAPSSSCYVCGAPVNLEKDGTHAGQYLYMIEISSATGEWILAEANAPDSQGCFPVGERCYRKILAPLGQKQ